MRGPAVAVRGVAGGPVPVGDQYFSKDNVYHYAWDTEHNFYIVFNGLAREAQSIDFEFDCSPRQLLNSGRSLIL